MSFAIQLFFDPESDSTIRKLWDAEADAGVPFPLRDSGNRPHFSLVISHELDVPACNHLLYTFAQTLAPFPLTISSLGVFPGERAVVFLAPVVTSNLFNLHRRVHQLLQGATTLLATHYLPEHWTPHCTLATRVPPQILPQVVTIGLGTSFPFSVSIEEIGVIEYPPVTHLFSFHLAGGNA